MLYDRRDFGLLRLAGAYQWLPLAPLRALSPLPSAPAGRRRTAGSQRRTAKWTGTRW